MKKDYLIIGQGIAGSLIAFELYKKGANFDIINKTDYKASSHVAAGLYNPVTGRKMVKTWNADKVFADLEHYYTELERFLKAKFLYPTKIYRPFLSLEEQNDWQGRLADGNFEMFVGELKTKRDANESINDHYGGLLLKNAGYIAVSDMLESFRLFFIERESYIETVLNINKLVEADGRIKYGDKFYKEVIFCEGNSVRDNPFFSWLPLKPVKGEIIDINIAYDESFILNRGVFMLPKSKEGYCRVGSTYDNHHLNNELTEEAKTYLKDKLAMIYQKDFEIVNHKAGIRPATRDRKPFIGRHPSRKEMSIFNGFGTKGVSLAVYYAKQFADFLINDGLIDDDVNIVRYFSFYSN